MVHIGRTPALALGETQVSLHHHHQPRPGAKICRIQHVVCGLCREGSPKRRGWDKVRGERVAEQDGWDLM
jgi:hypothetical protein